MSAKQEASKAEHKTKQFGKSERKVPHHTQKAKKFYPAEDESKPKKVRRVNGFDAALISLHIVFLQLRLSDTENPPHTPLKYQHNRRPISLPKTITPSTHPHH